MELSFFTCKFSWFVQGFEIKALDSTQCGCGEYVQDMVQPLLLTHSRDAPNQHSESWPVALDQISSGEKQNSKGGFHCTIFFAEIPAWFAWLEAVLGNEANQGWVAGGSMGLLGLEISGGSLSASLPAAQNAQIALI